MSKYLISSIILGIVFSLSTIVCTAQKKPLLSDKEVVIEYAYLELEESMKLGEFFEFAQESGVKGAFTFDVTIREKGEVSTVFAVKREGEVKDQNKVKDFIRDYKFQFKMPKGKSYKFQYTFQFN